MRSHTCKFILLGLLVGLIQPVGASIFTDAGTIPGINKLAVPEVDVSGTVKDTNGETLIGVNVVVKGTTIGVSTDFDGQYSIEGVEDNAVLVFSYVGYQTIEVEVDGQAVHDVVMSEDLQQLDEIVVVGYGAQKKANVVGAVTAVSGAEIEAIPAPDVTNAISGRLPGSIIIQESGEPGQDAAKILIRGRSTLGDATSPLVVIDGIPGRELNEIDPIDIASISVLKDASAAIYGSSAANGVILVTTKRGQSGLPRLRYQFYQGFMTPTILPEVTNAGDYATMLSEYQDYENRNRTYSDEDIALFYNGEDPWEHPNSKWVDDLIAKWNGTSKHNLTFDGGFKGMLYYVSAGYKNQEAIYEQESTNYKQYNIRARIEVPITEWFKTSVDYAGFLNRKLYPTKGAFDIFGQSTRLVPTQWSFWPNGLPGPDIEYGDNPVVTSTLETGYDDQKEFENQLTFRADITPKIIPGLHISGFYTYDLSNGYRKRFQKPWTLYFPKWETASRNSQGYITDMDLTPTPRGVSSPELNEYFNKFTRKMGNASISYIKEVGNHNFSLFGAYEQIDQDWNDFRAFRKYYISDLVQSINAGSDTDKDNSGSLGIYSLKSWIGRVSYNYDEKYLAEFLIRRDGSLKFPPNSRWGNFPAILLAWRASEEDFWKANLSFINYFKLRASYGKMGMDPGDPFQYVNKYVLASGLTLGSAKAVETVVQQSGVANPNITWEKQTTSNLGFDAQFKDNLFSLTAELFYNNRSDILTPRNASVPGFTGLQLPDENIAEVDNRGFEVIGGYHKVVNDDFRFDISANYSWSRNKVVFMDEPERAVPWQQRTGHPFGAALLYNAIGIFKDQADVESYPSWPNAKPGDIKFEDVSGDGVINSDDRILFDKTDAPESFFGISLAGVYKNWSLSVLIQGQGEYFRMNVQDGRRGEAGNYFQWHFDDRWTPDNTDASIARAYNRDDLYWSFDNNNSTYWWSNMAYTRLKNLVLGYNIPRDVFGNLGITRASIFFSGNNLLLIHSAQKNFDPEIGAPMVYPAVKTFAVGANVTF